MKAARIWIGDPSCMCFPAGPISGPGPDRYTQRATGQNTACTTLSATGCGVSAIPMKESGKTKSAAVTRKPPPSEISSHFFVKDTAVFEPPSAVYSRFLIVR